MNKNMKDCCENSSSRTIYRNSYKSKPDIDNSQCTCCCTSESSIMKNPHVHFTPKSNSKFTCKLNSVCNLVFLVFLILNQVLLSECGSYPVISAYESVNGVLTKLNVPANSDLVLSADSEEAGSADKNLPANGKSSRYLMLKCTATYPIQWIYSGDGIPEFTTNSTVNWETEPMVFMAAATLLKLSAHYTGNYTCRSITNFELSKHYYIYISGESFFTTTAGGPINYSRYDSSVRIPCGVSHPRVRVTLQKLVDGYVNCLQMNDSLSYDGKTGFRLQLADFNQPEGDYLCIASFNGTFNFVQYKLILDPNRQQSLYLPQPTKETSLSRIKCATFQQNCGVNALCTLDVNDEPICKCNRHHHGNPYQKCHPECMIDTDCPSNRICYNHACEDPCPNACGPSTELVQKCQVVNHKAICNYNSCNPSPCGKFSKCEDFNTRAVCSCLPGYIGSPPYCSEPIEVSGTGPRPNPNPSFEFVPVQDSSNSNPNSHLNSHLSKNHSNSISGISFPMGPMACRTRQDCPPYLTCRMNVCENPCYPNPCGRNGNCRVQNYEPICSCAPGFIKVNQYCLPNNCRADRECPESRSCVRNKCINPCNGYCGENAICAVKRHRPACACLPGHRGDPFQKCKPAAVQNTETHGLSMVLSNSAFANGMLMAPESPKYPILEQSPELDPVLDRSPSFSQIPQSPNPNPNSNQNSNSNSNPTVIPIPVSIQKLQNKNQNKPQNLKQPIPSSTSGPFPLPTPGIVQPFKLCDPASNSPKKSKCGANAKCLTTQSQHAYCQCSTGFTGDPYRFCYQIISLPNPSAPTTLIIKDLPGAGSALETEKEGESHFESSIESIVNANFAHLVTASGIVNRGSTTPASIPGHSFISNNYYNRKPVTTESTNAVTPVMVCVNNDDCPDDKMCITGSCFDPCSLFHPVCGQNQDCRVENHRSVCVCKPGYPVRIYNRCYRPGNYSSLSVCDRSSSNPCGPHSICNQREDGITCRCSSGAIGEPPNCRPKNASGKTGVKTVVNFKDDHSDSFSSISSSNSNSNTKKIPTTCLENEDCPNELNCRNNTCKDPCDGYCGVLARCRVYQHMPKCFCPNGFRGNPRIRCIAPLFNSRHTNSESLESKSSLEQEGLQFEFDYETTQRVTDMETETEPEVNLKSEDEKQIEMKTAEIPVRSKNTNTNTKPSQVRGVEKLKTETEENINRNENTNKRRTEKEKQDMARYEDEIFDDSNEFLF